MSDVHVTIGANSAPLESEFAKVKQSAGNLRKSIGDAGGVLEGDRRVENKMTAFVEGFKSAQNGADLLANTMGNLGDVFKTSLGMGVALNVGASLVGTIGSAITKANEEWKKFEQDGVKAISSINQAMQTGEAEKGLEKIAERLQQINEQRTKLSSFMGTMPTDLKSWAIALSGGAGGSILQKDANESKKAQMAREQSGLEKQRVLITADLLAKKQQELQIETLLAEGNTDAANKIKEQIAIVEELNKVKALGINATKEELALEQKIIEAIGQKGAQKMRDKPEEQDQHVKDFNAGEKALKEMLAWEKQQKDEFLKQQKSDQDKALEAGLQAFKRHVDEKQRLEDEAATKKRKAIDDADKLRLEGNRGLLKENEAIVKKGEQEQKQRDDRAMQAVQGGGLQALNAQRVSDRQAELAREKAAGILARHEVRRKYGGDVTKMSKEEIQAVKDRILGEKQLDKKKIEAAIAGIPAIEKNIANLVAKLGVK